LHHVLKIDHKRNRVFEAWEMGEGVEEELGRTARGDRDD
jgi:hypothetical protein